jgi:hypothetical protein
MAMAATIFTISCSGDDGSSGKDGSGCYVRAADDGGYDVLCGGSRVGSLLGGTQGTPGAPGGPGAPGAQGDACTLGDQAADGSFPIFCGSGLAGTLNGCSYAENDLFVNGRNDRLDFIVTCGSTIFGLCDGVAYNPSEQYCSGDATDPDVNLLDQECGTSKAKFNPVKQYCGYENKAAYDAKNATVMELCVSVAINQAAEIGSSGSGKWGWDAAVPSNNVWDPADKYCKVEIETYDYEDGKITYKKSESSPEMCDGSLIKPNNGAWGGQYCGFEKVGDLTRKLVSNACGDGKFPDEEAHGKAYCRMEESTHKLTQLSTAFCEVGTPSSFVATPINKVDKYTTLSAADWKDEYCGFESEEATEARRKSVLRGVCGDLLGPNDEDRSSWQNDYCQMPSKADILTKRVGGSTAYCVKDAGTAFKTADASARFNEGAWKDEYCGYSSKADADEFNFTVQTGICTDESKPNSASWGNEYCQARRSGSTTVSSVFCGIAAVPATKEYAGSINKDTWKDEYCGYASKAAFEAEPKALSVLTGVCNTDGSSSDVGPNQAQSNYTIWLNEYCQADKAGITLVVGTNAASKLDVFCLADTTDVDYSTVDASARINERTWNREYCGFASKAAFEAETKIFSKLVGICDDGYGPNQATSSYVAWTNDYCQVKNDSDKYKGLTAKVSGAANAPGIYCTEQAGSDFADADASARLNEGSWKGEFCFADNVKGICLGGQVPASSSALSTDNPMCAFE